MAHNTTKKLSASIEDFEVSDLHVKDQWHPWRLHNFNARSLPRGTLRESGVLNYYSICLNMEILPRCQGFGDHETSADGAGRELELG